MTFLHGLHCWWVSATGKLPGRLQTLQLHVHSKCSFYRPLCHVWLDLNATLKGFAFLFISSITNSSVPRPAVQKIFIVSVLLIQNPKSRSMCWVFMCFSSFFILKMAKNFQPITEVLIVTLGQHHQEEQESFRKTFLSKLLVLWVAYK